MIYTYRNIPNIVFPIYRLESDNWVKVDGLVFIDNMILDDTNMPGKTLGLRRIQTPMKNLYEFHRGSFEINYLLKYKYFIDNSGATFIYQKTKPQKLKYFKIKRVEKKDSASLIWFIDLPFPIEASRPPQDEFPYARILCLNEVPWFIYDFALEKGKDTRRII